MKTLLIKFAGCESGVTAIEYGLIAALVVITIIGAVNAVGTSVMNNFYGPLANAL